MKKIYIFIILFLFEKVGFGQEGKILKVDFFLPGITYEHKLWKQLTLESTAKLNIRTDYPNNAYFTFNPHISSQVNYYYNLEKRESLGRSTHLNSGNYFALGIGYEQNIGLEIIPENMNSAKSKALSIVNLGWGFQRTFKSHFYTNMLFGASYIHHGGFYPLINLKFGYILWSTRKNS